MNACQPHIGGHTNGDEEKTEQQALERGDVSLQFVTVFGLRQQYPGHEGTHRHRKPGEVRDICRTDHDQQRRGVEQLRRAGSADRSDQRRDCEAPADKNDRDRGRRSGHVVPRDVVGQGVLRQQWHESHQRDERQILEQQHREPVAAGSALQHVRLGQHRQHDRGGRHRQPSPQHDGAGPRDARDVRQGSQRRTAQHHLRRPKSEDRLPHHPQPPGTKFQSDQEQQHDNAKGRDVGDLIDVAD